MNIKSENIQVFPCANRNVEKVKDVYQQSMISEYSISSIVNKFIDTDGFIINKLEDVIDETGLQFNIHGYYFDIKKDEIANIRATFADKDDVYAYITIYELDESHKFNDLIGTDNETDYTGLTLVSSLDELPKIASAQETLVKENTLPNGTKIYSLHILTRDKVQSSATKDQLIIVDQKRRKFDLGAYGYQVLDGGEITE